MSKINKNKDSYESDLIVKYFELCDELSDLKGQINDLFGNLCNKKIVSVLTFGTLVVIAYGLYLFFPNMKYYMETEILLLGGAPLASLIVGSKITQFFQKRVINSCEYQSLNTKICQASKKLDSVKQNLTEMVLEDFPSKTSDNLPSSLTQQHELQSFSYVYDPNRTFEETMPSNTDEKRTTKTKKIN